MNIVTNYSTYPWDTAIHKWDDMAQVLEIKQQQVLNIFYTWKVWIGLERIDENIIHKRITQILEIPIKRKAVSSFNQTSLVITGTPYNFESFFFFPLSSLLPNLNMLIWTFLSKYSKEGNLSAQRNIVQS